MSNYYYYIVGLGHFKFYRSKGIPGVGIRER